MALAQGEEADTTKLPALPRNHVPVQFMTFPGREMVQVGGGEERGELPASTVKARVPDRAVTLTSRSAPASSSHTVKR